MGMAVAERKYVSDLRDMCFVLRSLIHHSHPLLENLPDSPEANSEEPETTDTHIRRTGEAPNHRPQPLLQKKVPVRCLSRSITTLSLK